MIKLDWLRLEQEECSPYDLVGVILLLMRSSPVITSTVCAWKQIRTHFDSLSLSIPIAGNPFFIPPTIDKSFYQWRDMEIHIVGNLYQNVTSAFFEKIQEKCQKSNFFRFLQVRNYVQSYLKRFATINPLCLDTCLKVYFGKGKIISCIYNSLQSSLLPATSTSKSLWEEKIWSEILNEIWADSQKEMNRCSINSYEPRCSMNIISFSSKYCIDYIILTQSYPEYFKVSAQH